MKYSGKVRYNGNHYFAGSDVSGSKIEYREDGTIWLFDDEEFYVSVLGDLTRYDWVEIDPDSLQIEDN